MSRYLLALVVSLVCVLYVARIARNFTSVRTVEWLGSAAASLAIQWACVPGMHCRLPSGVGWLWVVSRDHARCVH
jgi:hypothetical protein|eukprot:COSAG01_NODE_603_length_14905_cov_12.534648_16_plen_75_part_00